MKWLKRIGITILSLLLLCSAGLFILGKYYQEELISLFTKELNKNLLAEIKVGNIQLNTFSNFPNAAIEFHQLVCFEPNSSSDTLFKAEKLTLEFSLSDILHGNYLVKNVSLYQGFIKAKVSPKGEANYKIWKESESSSGVAIKLKQLNLQDMHLSYRDFLNQQALVASFHQSKLSGDLSQGFNKIQLSGDLNLKRFRYAELLIEDNIPISLNSYLLVENDQWNLEAPSFIWKGNKSSIAGWYNQESYSFDINFANLSTADALAYLPKNVVNSIASYQPKGSLNLNLNIAADVGRSASYTGTFSIKDGKFTRKETNTQLDKVQAKGYFNYPGNAAEAELIIEDFTAGLDRGSLAGSISYQNFISPRLSMDIQSALNWKDLLPFIGLEDVHDIQGNVSSNFSFSCKFKSATNITKSDFTNAQLKGNLESKRMGFKLGNSKADYRNINAKLSFEKGVLQIENLTGFIDESDFKIQGTCNNLLPYLFIENQKLNLTASLESSTLKLDQILDENSTSNTESSYQLSISPNIKASIDFQVKDFSFHRFAAKDLQGEMSLNNQILSLSHYQMSCLEGTTHGTFQLDARSKDLKMNGYAELASININSLFYSFENFGQDYLRDQHLRGNLGAKVSWSGDWARDLSPDLNSIKVRADLQVNKGELINFEPMEALAGYVKLEELKHIYFQNLSNHVNIENQIVSLTHLKIRSSALTVDLSGEHSFDNHIDYRFKLLLSELLTKKVKNEDPELYGDFAVIKDDDVQAAIYLKMTGTVDNPVIAYDRTSLKEKIKDEIKEEKKELISLIKDEFKPQSPDTSQATPIKHSGFIIEWDEDEDPDGGIEDE